MKKHIRLLLLLWPPKEAHGLHRTNRPGAGLDWALDLLGARSEQTEHASRSERRGIDFSFGETPNEARVCGWPDHFCWWFRDPC